MFSFLKHFKFYFAFLLVVSVLSFYGSYYSEATNNSTAVNFISVTDIDNADAQQFAGTSEVLLSIQYSPVMHFTALLADTIILPANPGPANNGLSAAGAGILFNLIGGPRDLFITSIKTALTAAAGAPVRFEVYIRDGNALGGPVGSGPGSSLAGWTLIDTADGFQGPVSNGISELITIGPIPVGAGDTVGVALKFLIAGPRYFGIGTPPLENYLDTNLRLITGDARSAVFTTTGSWFSSRALTGELRYVVSTTTGITNINTGIPEEFILSQNYPNPFNPNTNIEFAVPEKSYVILRVYDASGREVAILASGLFTAGTYRVNWDAGNLSSGVYFYRMQSGSFTQTRKLLLVK